MTRRAGEYQYLRVLQRLVDKYDRLAGKGLQMGPQGVPAVNIGATTMVFDLSRGHIPLLTTKKMFYKGIVVELEWFLRGLRTLDYLHERGVRFWDQWATQEVAARYGLEEWDAGETYTGWRHFPDGRGGELDQITWLVNALRDPRQREWRRWKITMWHPRIAMWDTAMLAPCHGDAHFIMVDGRLSLHHMQRSGDWFLGVPFNIASYATLLLMVCHVTGCKPGKLVQFTSDTHMYADHVEGARTQLSRTPYPFPRLCLDPECRELLDFQWPKGYELVNYLCHPAIGAEAAL